MICFRSISPPYLPMEKQKYLYKNARCGTTSSIISNWLSSSAYVSMQKYRPIAYIGGMTLVALVSMWIFIQQTHITDYDSDSDDSNDPKNSRDKSNNRVFPFIRRENVTSAIGRKRGRTITPQNNTSSKTTNNLPISGSNDSKQLNKDLNSYQQKLPKFRARRDYYRSNKKSKPSLTEVNNDNSINVPIIGSCGCTENKSEVVKQNENLKYQNLRLLGRNTYGDTVSIARRSRSNHYNQRSNSRFFAGTTYISRNTHGSGEKLHDTFYTNSREQDHKAGASAHFNRFQNTVRHDSINEIEDRRIACEVENIINDVQDRISDALNKIRSFQINEVSDDRDDVKHLEPSLTLNSLKTIEQDRFDRDIYLKTQLEKQIELEDEVEFILKMIKGSRYSDSNGENWISNNYFAIPMNVNDSQKSGNKVVTFATLASDIDQASQRRIIRNFEILEILKQKKLAEKLIEGSLECAIDIVKSHTLARARSTKRLKRPHKISNEIDDVNKKLLYIDSWQKDMIDKLNGLECEFDALEKMIDDEQILTDLFVAGKSKEGEG